MSIGKKIFNEKELVSRSQKGDVSAYALLVKEYSSGILTFINRIISSKEDAEDVSQEVFIKAYKAINRFKGHSSFKTYIYAIAKNECYSYLKKKNPKRISLDENAEMENCFSMTESNISAEEVFVRNDFVNIVRKSLKEIPQMYNAIIQLYFYKQFKYEEIAETLEIPMGTVKTHLFRGVKLLRKEVLKNLEGENTL